VLIFSVLETYNMVDMSNPLHTVLGLSLTAAVTEWPKSTTQQV